MRLAVAAGLVIAYLTYLFRVPSGVFLTHGLGDWIDPYFINYLFEHWYQWIGSWGNPASPPMFHPERGTLGYSHGLVLFALPYVIVRPFLHPFMAHTVTAFVVMLGGTVALVELLRRAWRLSFIESLAVSALFLTSTNVAAGGTGVWLQRASVFLIPPICLLWLKAFRVRRAWKRNLVGGLAGFVSALLLTQDYYTVALAVLVGLLCAPGWLPSAWLLGRRWIDAWRHAAIGRDPVGSRSTVVDRLLLVSAGLALVVSLVIWLFPIPRIGIGPVRISASDATRPLLLAAVLLTCQMARRWRVWFRARRLVTSHPPTAFAVWSSAGLAAGVAIFVSTYVGVYLEGRTFPRSQILDALQPWPPPPAGSGFVGVLRALVPYESVRPFLTAAILALIALWPDSGLTARRRWLAIWTLVVAFIIGVFGFRWSEWSLWESTVGHLPGLSVIRNPRLVILLFELATVVSVATVVAGLPPGRRLRRAAVPIFLVLLVLTWNRSQFDYYRSMVTFEQWVERPLSIDPSCEAFYIRAASADYASRSPHVATLYGIDAMFISLRTSLPTLNGYSAWAPQDWSLANPPEATYERDVASWIERRHLTGACALDIDSRRMTPIGVAR